MSNMDDTALTRGPGASSPSAHPSPEDGSRPQSGDAPYRGWWDRLRGKGDPPAPSVPKPYLRLHFSDGIVLLLSPSDESEAAVIMNAVAGEARLEWLTVKDERRGKSVTVRTSAVVLVEKW